MAKTQAKMKEYQKVQPTMNSLDRLSETLNGDTSYTALGSSTTDEATVTTDHTTTATPPPSSASMEIEGTMTTRTTSTPTCNEKTAVICGENKAMPHRKMSRHQKHMIKAKINKPKKEVNRDRPKPKYFCQF